MLGLGLHLRLKCSISYHRADFFRVQIQNLGAGLGIKKRNFALVLENA